MKTITRDVPPYIDIKKLRENIATAVLSDEVGVFMENEKVRLEQLLVLLYVDGQDTENYLFDLWWTPARFEEFSVLCSYEDYFTETICTTHNAYFDNEGSPSYYALDDKFENDTIGIFLVDIFESEELTTFIEMIAI